MAWPKGAAPELPWAVHYVDETVGLYADDAERTTVSSMVVELYERQSDSELEERVRNALEGEFGPTRRTESWVADENCLEVVFYFTAIERKDQ